MPGGQRPVWVCPRCDARLVSRNLWHSCGEHTLEALFAGAGPEALDLAREYVALLESLGDVQVLAQNTRLVCVARVRFAGAAATLPSRPGGIPRRNLPNTTSLTSANRGQPHERQAAITTR